MKDPTIDPENLKWFANPKHFGFPVIRPEERIYSPAEYAKRAKEFPKSGEATPTGVNE